MLFGYFQQNNYEIEFLARRLGTIHNISFPFTQIPYFLRC